MHVGGLAAQLRHRLPPSAAAVPDDLPLAERFEMPAAVPCPGGCAAVEFCSEACAKEAWEAHHKALCAGPGGEAAGAGEGPVHALAEFEAHAKETNDAFLLAAQVLARVSCAADAEGVSLQEAWAPFACGHKGIWWEILSRPDDVAEGEEEAEFRSSLKELAFDSLELLRAALPARAAAHPELFSLEVYASVMGLFELNNLALVVDSPVENYFLEVDELPEGPEKDAVEAVTQPLLDALDKDYSLPLEGNAFYGLQSLLNHDCDPNCYAFKRDTDVNGDAVILARRGIEEGEELTISYCEEAATLKERRAALADYGFVCTCTKCERDAERVRARRKGKQK